MKNLHKALLLPVLMAFVVACSDGSGNNNDRPRLTLAYSDTPIELMNVTAMYAQDVRYGDAERNVLDIYLPDCDGPTPLVIYVHGGGFTGGDKERTHEQNKAHITEFLQACVAYATINYTLLDVPSAEEGTQSAIDQGGVLPSLLDAARALQFLRYYYESLNLEPENVAMYGASAGAGASLWLGTHDDLADPGNPDPVLRESSRIKAVGAIATQSTYDLLLWEDILLPVTEPFADLLGGTDIPTVAAGLGVSNYLLTFLGVGSIDDIFGDENVAYRANVDMIGLMDASDAPIFVNNFNVGFDDLLNTFLHHGLHALAVRDRAVEVGLHNVTYVDDPVYGVEDPSGESLTSFLMRHIR